MSYQVLARKWRPKSFADMVGQSHVLQALTNALDNNRLHHAYLFTGTRGVGKTTLARILAKCLNCEQGVSSTPCGVCSACVSIDEGRFVDLIEVDAASRAKVDETRDLMDNVQYAPSVGRYKVYLIDEVHMFSNHSFNALLKTLEEPPPHVKFLLATTEAKKIPVTILSRCLQFNLKLLGVDQIENQLAHILTAENIESDATSRHLIAVAADGSLRDALSLLDHAISYGGGRLEENQVRAMLGTIDSLELNGLLEAMSSGDAAAVLKRASHIAEHNPDYDSVLVELMSLLQKVAVCQVLPDQEEISDIDPSIKTMSKQISKEDVQLYYQIALAGRRDLTLAPDPRSGFEMTLIRMLAFRPISTVSHQKVIQGQPASNESGLIRMVAKVDSNTVAQENRPSQTNKPVSSADNFSGIVSPDDWRDIIDEMALAGLVKEFAGHCVLREHTKDKIHLALSPAQEHLLNTAQKDRLHAALKTRFGDQIKIVLTVEDPDSETPAQRKIRQEQERQLAAEKSVESDPNIQLMKELFDATVDVNSIRSESN
jgi:DNA polymerase-3 subunit gamma/tau